MIFTLSEEQVAVKEAARQFAQIDLKPGVIERDSHMKYPTEQVRKMGELGFMGMMVSPEYGGGGMDTMSYVLAMEELSKVDNSCSVIMSVNNSLVCWGIETYGTEEQKRKYLPKIASGETIGSFCLSEPESGSDAAGMKTKRPPAMMPGRLCGRVTSQNTRKGREPRSIAASSRVGSRRSRLA